MKTDDAMFEMKQERDRERRDAARYRWLRAGLEAGRSEAHQIARDGCKIDAAIDASMKGANL